MMTAVELGAMGGDDHLERMLIDALAQMSYLRGFGHVVLGREKHDTAAKQGR
jgi:hypothetical protein